MNSKSKAATEKTIKEVFDLTDEQYLNHFIDEPLDKAVNSFQFFETDPLTPREFIRIISNYIKHIYKHGLGVKQKLSEPQTRSVMLNILETGYRGPHDSGFDAAFLDATDSELSGIQFILNQLADYIKRTERQKHIGWVFTTRIENLDWNTKCLIAEVLLKKWGRFLPPAILGCASFQLVSCLPELIESLSEIVNNLMGSDSDLNFF